MDPRVEVFRRAAPADHLRTPAGSPAVFKFAHDSRYHWRSVRPHGRVDTLVTRGCYHALPSKRE